MVRPLSELIAAAKQQEIDEAREELRKEQERERSVMAWAKDNADAVVGRALTNFELKAIEAIRQGRDHIVLHVINRTGPAANYLASKVAAALPGYKTEISVVEATCTNEEVPDKRRWDTELVVYLKV